MSPSRRRPARPAFAGFVFTLGLPAATSLAAAPFRMIVVPDTQNYTDFSDINTQYNIGQMNWIRDNRSNLNIKFVMHLGDLQNPGNTYRARTDDIYEPDLDRPLGDVDEKQTKWNRASNAIQVLDSAGIPYSLVPGNHDYLDHDTKSEPWLYLKTFGPSRYTNNPKRDENNNLTYGGASPAGSSNPYAGMNTYHRVSAGGYKFLNIALQFAPDNDDLTWAQKIINENPGLPTVITTHSYVNTKPAGSDYQRQVIFDDLVKNNPQIVMTFNGHLTGAHYVAGQNIAGKTVHQMLVDFQASQLDAQLGDDYYRGGGALRMVEFDPDNSRVNIKDYSPIANKYLPNNFTAPDNDGDIATYSTPTGFDLDLNGRFGRPNGLGINRSISFRQGTNGYTGTRDTYLDASAATTNFGESTIAWVDGDRDGAAAGNQPAHALIRFDFITGDTAIPAGAIVKSATLTLHTSSLTDSQSSNTMSLHRVLKGWQEPSATWNSQTDGISADAADAILAANGEVVPSQVNQFVSFDVTESVWAWLDGAPNNGWALLPGGGNGWRWDTSETTLESLRPMLSVDFTLNDPVAFKWNVADGNWATGGNWLTGGVPGATDRALIDRGAAGSTVHVNTNVADIFSLSVRNGNILSIEPGGDVRNTGMAWDDPNHAFRIGDGSGGSVIINNGTLANVNNWLTGLQSADVYVGVGAGGNGTLTQGGALSRVEGRELRIGSGTGASGVYNHNGGVAQANMLVVGHTSGTGTYNLNGGTLNASQLRAGFGNATTGNLNIQAGAVNLTSDGYFGVNGSSTIVQSGGTITSAGSIYVGRAVVSGQTRGTGQYTLSGSGALAAGADLVIGSEGGLGAFTQNGGSVNAPRYLIVGTGQGTGFFGDGTFNQNGGTTTVGTELRIGVAGAAGRYNLAGGTLNAGIISNNGAFNHSGGVANVGALIGAGTTTAGAGVNLTLDRVTQAAINVDGKLTVRPNGTASGVSRITTVNLGPAGKLDLTDNKLITPSSLGSWNGAAYTGVAGLVDVGRGDASNAQWDGARGIVTSDTRAVNNNDLVSVGTAKVGAIRNIADGATTLFAGQTVSGSDTLAMVTWAGDANLDGKINIDDYGQIDFNVSASGSVFGWFNGDFNYDGKINIDDYGIIDFNVTAQGPAFSTTGVAPLDGVSAIPEPSAAAVCVVVASAGLFRRRRRV